MLVLVTIINELLCCVSGRYLSPQCVRAAPNDDSSFIMNCAQNEKKGAAKKKVKRLATVAACRNIRIQQQGRVKRADAAAAAAQRRPLKGAAAAKPGAKGAPAAKPAAGAKPGAAAKPAKPKLKPLQLDLDDSDTSSVASASRGKRAVKGAEAEAPPTDAPKKVAKVVAFAKNNIQKSKLKAGNASILKYLKKPAGRAKAADNVKAKHKWVVSLKQGAGNSRRSQGAAPEEGRSDSPAPKKPKAPAEGEGEPVEAAAGECAEPAAAPDTVKKPAVRKASVGGCPPRVTRSLGDRVLRNGKSSKAKKTLLAMEDELANVKRRRFKTEDDVKSAVGEEAQAPEPQPQESQPQEPALPSVEAAAEEQEVAEPEPPKEPEVAELPEPAPGQQPTLHPVSPYTPDEEVSRFPKSEEAEEPKTAVAVTTPLSPVSPVANSILSNKNLTDTNSNVCTNSVKENRKPVDCQPIKTADTLINDILPDWDSDEDGQGSLRDGHRDGHRDGPREAKLPFGNSSPAQVTKENEAPKYSILNKAPNRQVVSTPPLIEPDKPKIEDKSEGFLEPSDSRSLGMKMPPTTECLLKTKEINGFADSVELLAKRSSKIDFEILRRRTKRSMSLNVDPNDKLSPNKRTYGASKARETLRLVSMPKLSPEVDLPLKSPAKMEPPAKMESPIRNMESPIRNVESPIRNTESPIKNVGQQQTDKTPKSEELFDSLIGRTKDEINETDDGQAQAPPQEGDVGAQNGTCEGDDKKDMEEELTSSTPVASPSAPPVDPGTQIAAEEAADEGETGEKEDVLKHDDDASFGSEKRSDDFSLHLTVDSVDENSLDKQLDAETMDSEIADLPKDDEPPKAGLTEGAVSQDENSSEHPLSPPKLKPFDSDSLIDEEEMMAEMVETPEEAGAEPEKEVEQGEHKEEDNSNSSEGSDSYIQKLIESQEEDEEPKAEEATAAGGEQVTPSEGEAAAEGELTTLKDKEPEPRAEVQPSARIDSKETCGSSASSLSSILDADTTRLNLDLNLAELEKKRREIFEEEESPERRAVKEHVLNSLGLQSLRSVAEAAALSTGGPGRTAKRAQRKDSGGAGAGPGAAASSGRLKVVINVPKEKSKPLRMLFKNGKPYPSHPEALQTAALPVADAEEGDPNTPAMTSLEVI